MSVAVALEALRAHIEARGWVAFLVTAGADRRPHVVSAQVRMDDEALVVEAGKTSQANAALADTVTLLWPPSAIQSDYSLIVDGEPSVDAAGSQIAIRPTRAVLHRSAAADESLANCVTIV